MSRPAKSKGVSIDKIEIRVTAPADKTIDPQLASALSEILQRVGVAFEVIAGEQCCDVSLIDTTESEVRFVARILERAGYRAEFGVR